MSKLLIDEPPLQVLPTLAKVIGLNEAIILQQVHYWLNENGKTYEGKKWIYNTYADWRKQFPFWSESTIKRTIKRLEEQGLLISGNFNRMKLDRTKWYTINYEKLAEIEQSLNQDDPTKSSKCTDEEVKMTQSHQVKMTRPITRDYPETNKQRYIESAPQTSPSNPSPANSQSTKTPDLPPDIGTIDDWLSWSLEDFRAVWKRHGKELERSHPRYAGVLKYIGAHLKYLGTTPSPMVVERLVNMAAPDYWITGAVDEMIATLRNGGDPKNFNLERFYRTLRKYEQMNLPTDRNPYKYLEERRQERDENAVKL